MHKKRYLLYVLVIFYFLYILIFKNQYISLIEKTVPFREMYFPTVFSFILVYIVPTLFGFLIRRTNEIKDLFKDLCYLILFSLIISIPNLILLYVLRLDYYQSISITYILILNPVLIILGYFLADIRYKDNNLNIFTIFEKEKNKKYYILIISLIILLIFLLNLIPLSLSKYPVGADIHYHLALTNSLKNNNIFQNPLFYEETNIYPPLINLIILKISEITNISIYDLWRVYVPICSLFFIIIFFIFVKLLTNSNLVGILSVLFLSSWSQLIFSDISPRLLGWTFLVLSLIFLILHHSYKNITYLILFITSCILLLLIHIELFLHVLIILLFLFLIYKIKIIDRILALVKSNYDYVCKESYFEKSSFNKMKLIVILGFYFFIFFIIILKVLKYQNIGESIIFNEIPLSLFYPFGIISFLIIILAIPSFFNLINAKKNFRNSLILSVIFLLSNSFFYFTHIWSLHHRYFGETAYLGVVILSAITFKELISSFKPFLKVISLILVIGFLIISLYPRYDFIVYYSPKTEMNIDFYYETLSAIKENTNLNDVILVHPEDMINRYIPSFSERYIFGGTGTISKSKQWSIISGCESLRGNICEERLNYSKKFFEDPTNENLLEIKENYKIDYLLIQRSFGKRGELLQNIPNLIKIFENNKYTLYKLDLIAFKNETKY